MHSPDQQSMRGTILWFNEVKDAGLIRSADGEQFAVSGCDFTGGKRPQGRATKAVISFEVSGSEDRTVSQIAFVPEEAHGRARPRHGNRMRL